MPAALKLEFKSHKLAAPPCPHEWVIRDSGETCLVVKRAAGSMSDEFVVSPDGIRLFFGDCPVDCGFDDNSARTVLAGLVKTRKLLVIHEDTTRVSVKVARLMEGA